MLCKAISNLKNYRVAVEEFKLILMLSFVAGFSCFSGDRVKQTAPVGREREREKGDQSTM